MNEAIIEKSKFSIEKAEFEQTNPSKGNLSYQDKHDAIVEFAHSQKLQNDMTIDQLHNAVNFQIDCYNSVIDELKEQKSNHELSIKQHSIELNKNVADMSINMMNADLPPYELKQSTTVNIQPLLTVEDTSLPNTIIAATDIGGSTHSAETTTTIK
jgi:hypothetical protein